MEVKAKLNFLRVSPRKARLVADLIRGKKIEEAQDILSFTIKKSSKPLLKLLNSALANAKNNLQLEPANLYISEIRVDEGPKYKRWRARSRGQANPIQKKTSKISLVLDELKPTKKVKKAKKEKIQVQRVQERPSEQAPEKEFGVKEDKKPALSKSARVKNIFRRKSF